MLKVNEVYEGIEGAYLEGKYRIVKIDEISNLVALFKLSGSPEKPLIEDYALILTAIENNEMLRRDYRLPTAFYLKDDELPEKWRVIRDKNWEIIEPIVVNSFDRFIFGEYSSKIITKRADDLQIQRKTVYRHVYRYLEFGMVKNALLPSYANSGGKGKTRAPRNKKRGSPVQNIQDSEHGINIDEEERKIIQRSIKMFYKNSENSTLKRAYTKMIETFYVDRYELVNGEEKKILKPSSECPTLRQFTYWYKKENDELKILEAKIGTAAYRRNHRGLGGKSNYGLFGPTHTYEIDATIADVFLVSSYDPKRLTIIGKPVVYIVIDVFSRMIVGYYIGLEGPSWEGARLALFNAMRNKVELCKEIGLDIKPEDWPCEHICHNITADRAELTSSLKNQIFESLSIDTVSITSPYRADCKGLVERQFQILNESVIHFLPGSYHRNRVRGDKRPELDAVLTIEEFSRIIVDEIITVNKTRPKQDILTKKMIEEKVTPVPIKVWNWGLENMTGDFVHRSQEELYMGLLPQGEATVTREGIVFKGMTYTCERAMRENWYAKARSKRWKIPVLYTASSNTIWYVDKINGSFEECSLRDWQEHYKNKRVEEVQDLLDLQKVDRKQFEEISRQKNFEKSERQQSIVKNAISEQAQSLKNNNLPKSKRLNGVRDNRKKDKEMRRQNVMMPQKSKIQPKINNIVNIDSIEQRKRKKTSRLLDEILSEENDD